MTCHACGSVGALTPLEEHAGRTWCASCWGWLQRRGWGYAPDEWGHPTATRVDLYNGGQPVALRVPGRVIIELGRELPPPELAVAYIRQKANK